MNSGENIHKSDKDTSWQAVAPWYDRLLETDENSFQEKVILPNLERLLDPKTGEKIVDIACGQGFFSRAFAKKGANIVAVDLSKDLIEAAKAKESKNISYSVASADNMPSLESAGFDKAYMVLALQNIRPGQEAILEASRILKAGGKFFLVLNHPIFRVPKSTSWGFDEEQKKQYRRIDSYMSEAEIAIDMNPGKKNAAETFSFHRPLQWYFKAFQKAGFSVLKLEEWISHKHSQKGPRQSEEDRLRKEIPMFICIELKKI